MCLIGECYWNRNSGGPGCQSAMLEFQCEFGALAFDAKLRMTYILFRYHRDVRVRLFDVHRVHC